MKKLERNHKRIIIIVVYVILFTFISWGLYNLFKPAPTCFDGKKNQNELGVDCGGVCGECQRQLNAQALSVTETAFVLGDVNKYDVMARITNPNISLGSASFDYEFTLKDASGNILATRQGKDFILPKESKYVVEVNLTSAQVPASVTFAVKNYQWSEFFGYEEPRLIIYQKNFTQSLESTGKSEAKGLLVNESPFDFDLIKINVILRDPAGKVAGVGSYEMRTMNSGQQRDFTVLWPAGMINLPSGQDGLEMEPEANVFDSQNFIKKYLEGQPLY